STPTIAPSGPGARYALSQQPTNDPSGTSSELPESYGTGKLFLTAQDPHWLYAACDLTREQQKIINAQSRDGHLGLRVRYDNLAGRIAIEAHVHPESRSWFVFTPKAETRYVGELGFYSESGTWQGVASSKAATTPPDSVAEEAPTEFAT